MGLRVDGAGRRAGRRAADQATQALLGVDLHKIKRREQMLWAPPPLVGACCEQRAPKGSQRPSCLFQKTRERAVLPSTPTLHNETPGFECSGKCPQSSVLLIGINQVDGLVVIHPGNVGDVVVRHGGEGGRRSEGIVRVVVRCGCVCVYYVLFAFRVKACGSASGTSSYIGS